MSDVKMSWETWCRFAKQSGTGVAGTTFHTYDADAADSLTMGETPIERTGVHGARGMKAAHYRKGQYLPGGQLGPYPFHMDANSAEMLKLWTCHFQGSALGTGDGTAPNLWTLTPATSQIDSGAFYYLTFQKDTGIAGAGEQYLDCLIDEMVFSWAADQQYLTIQPTIKALTGGTTTTVTGDGTAIDNGYFTCNDLDITFNGTAIYPTSFSVTTRNGIPDRQTVSVRGRKSFSLDHITGEVSLSIPRDSDFDTWFVDNYGNTGTFNIQGTLPSSFGTTVGGTALSFDYTVYAEVNPVAQPTGQSGELIDTVTATIVTDVVPTLKIWSDLHTY